MTEATQTIDERLAADYLQSVISDGQARTLKDDLDALHLVVSELGIEDSFVAPVDAVVNLKSEITRLQSELNTALERVKVLEDQARKVIASQNAVFKTRGGTLEEASAYIGLGEAIGDLSLIVNDADEIKAELHEAQSRAVLQSSGGK